MKISKSFFILVLSLFFIIFQGCGKITYSNLNLNLNYKANNTPISVAVLDLRPYILSGERDSNYVAIERGGYGNIWHETTSSKLPLSEELTDSLKQNFSQVGFNITSIKTEGLRNKQRVVDDFKNNTSSKLVLLILNEYKSDTFVNSWFMYDIDVYVINNDGKELAYETSKGKINVDGNWFWPFVSRKRVPLKSGNVLEELLNRQSIVNALE